MCKDLILMSSFSSKMWIDFFLIETNVNNYYYFCHTETNFFRKNCISLAEFVFNKPMLSYFLLMYTLFFYI